MVTQADKTKGMETKTRMGRTKREERAEKLADSIATTALVFEQSKGH